MASVQNIGISGEKIKADNERTTPSLGMSKETSPAPLNKSHTAKESYWFAHSGPEDASPANTHPDPKAGGDPKEQQLQKDKEEKIRVFREQQEEERLKRMRDLEQQFVQAKKHREQQEEERRRRIEEARIKELERRQQVEERKRQIWEAEQERKEAILRRNMEREARIEARRNAQRNSQCFAFGSSTPRSFDLDLAAIGVGRNTSPGSILMSSVGRRSEEREVGPPRATSACSLDRKLGEDCMSRSMVSLSSSTFRGRRRTDIMPALTRERSITPHITPRGNHSMRAVSMTRLDQLAQPRRTYPRSYATDTTTTKEGPRTVSPSMSKSMCNLANSSTVSRKTRPPLSSRNDNSSMSRSMLHLADSPQRENRGLTPSPTLPKSSMRPAQSMMHLAVAPRLTRTARLRAEALAGKRTVSAWNLNKTENYPNGQYLSPGKDTSRSPPRPQSSLSGTSEVSATSSSVSAVNMRPRPAPRRPRPYSVAGSIVDATTVSTQSIERQTRLHERNVPAPAHRPVRAKSASRESTEPKTFKPLTAPRKPVPPPKSSDLLARAKSHPVPIKDNLRKVGKSSVNKSLSSDSKVPAEPKEKLNTNQNSTDKIECKRKCDDSVRKEDSPVPEAKVNSALTSPVTDLDMFIVSSDDSKVSATEESDRETFSQSATESDPQVQESVVAPSLPSPERSSSTEKTAQNESVDQIIPTVAQQKEDTAGNINAMQTSMVEESGVRDSAVSKPRITSEEEARAALAEKRRLAREQAEREAELERQRLEEIRRQEEEQRRLEELEQKRMEEEQIRLAELHRQLEQEKLNRAIEEQQQREREEQERREEEARQKAEKEEQEKKAREEAEKQRIELEEKLRKEEEERAERKRRVEQIMARTRGRAAQSPAQSENILKSVKTPENATPPTTLDASKTDLTSQLNEVSKVPPMSNGIKASSAVVSSSFNGTSGSHTVSNTNSWSFSEEKHPLNNSPLPDILNTGNVANQTANSNGPFVATDEQLSKISISSSFTMLSNRTLSANDDTSPQTNGYSSHEDMSCTTSPEESADMGLLIDIQSCQQKSTKISPEPTDFTQLVDLEPTSLDNNVNNDNYLIHVDDVNSNLFNSANPFVAFDDSLQKKQDTQVADLLS